jgi:hypothetical protein
MRRDEVVVALLLCGLGAWAYLHVTLAWKLAARAPRWRGAVGLAVPPLAAYWGWLAGYRVHVSAWALVLVTWAAVRVFLSG